MIRFELSDDMGMFHVETAIDIKHGAIFCLQYLRNYVTSRPAVNRITAEETKSLVRDIEHRSYSFTYPRVSANEGLVFKSHGYQIRYVRC